MNIEKAIEILELHNKWRRDNDGKYEMAEPKELGKAIDLVVSEFKNLHLQNVSGSFLPKCTRVEVIDQSGRAYVNWKPTNKVETMMQDDNKTLKVFIS